MGRPVETNSTCPRYAYFRARYLAMKEGRLIRVRPQPENKPTKAEIAAEFVKRVETGIETMLALSGKFRRVDVAAEQIYERKTLVREA